MIKEDDDVEYFVDDNDDDEESVVVIGFGLLDSVVSLGSVISGCGGRRRFKKWRWDLEYLEMGLICKMVLGFLIYGVCVMVVCLVMNVFFSVYY